jgi:protein-S-isoprenylcysteine O-methyltransferase Ste14
MTIQPWNVVFFVGFVAYTWIRGHYIKRTKSVEKVLNRKDTLERSLFGIVLVGNLLLPVVYLFTPLLGFADYRLPTLLPWCGLAVMLAALWLFWRSHADLGLNWSVTLELRKDHELIDYGVYRTIRHPMYASIWLFGLAQGLLLENWLAGWAAVATFAPMYFLRTPREERMMRECFGPAYEEYMARTGRLLPKFGRRTA